MRKKYARSLVTKYGSDEVFCHCGCRMHIKETSLIGGRVYACRRGHRIHEKDVKVGRQSKEEKERLRNCSEATL